MVKHSFFSLLFIINIISAENKIFFVYNSHDDIYTIFTDTIHKTIKPATYSCQLCKLTYNTFNKKKKWESFLSNLKYESVFLYRDDEFIRKKNISEFPIILFGSSDELQVLLSKEDINKNRSLDELINMIHIRLK